MAEPEEWDCDAYGPGSASFGARCFVAETGERACASHDECRRVVNGERQRVFQRIQERAAEGDPDMAYLAEAFTSPEQLLGGEEAAESDG